MSWCSFERNWTVLDKQLPKQTAGLSKTKIAMNDFLDWMSLPEQAKNLFDSVINNIIVIIDRLKTWENNWNFAVPPLTAFGVEWGPEEQLHKFHTDDKSQPRQVVILIGWRKGFWHTTLPFSHAKYKRFARSLSMEGFRRNFADINVCIFAH